MFKIHRIQYKQLFSTDFMQLLNFWLVFFYSGLKLFVTCQRYFVTVSLTFSPLVASSGCFVCASSSALPSPSSTCSHPLTSFRRLHLAFSVCLTTSLLFFCWQFTSEYYIANS